MAGMAGQGTQHGGGGAGTVPYLVTSRAHTEADEAARLSGLFPARACGGGVAHDSGKRGGRAGGRAERCCIHPTNTLSPSTAWGWDGIIS